MHLVRSSYTLPLPQGLTLSQGLPVHNVELFAAVGANGVGLMVTLVVPIGPGQPPTVANTE